MTDEHAKLRELQAKATPGDWIIHPTKRWVTSAADPDGSPICELCHSSDGIDREDEALANAALIVTAVNALSGLRDTIERMTAELEKARARRFYIDCEFDGHGGPLISFAIVGEGNDSLHIEVMDAPPPNDPWVAENVLPILRCHQSTTAIGVPLLDVGGALRRFIGDEPAVIIADSPVDIGRFCQVISTGEDGGWQSFGLQRVTFEVHNVDCWPCDLPGAVQHNAWWDAMALRHKLERTEHDRS